MNHGTISTILTILSFCTRNIRAETIRGVNLGGWLLVEEWYVRDPDLHSKSVHVDEHRITPSLFRDTDAEDEWNLCNSLGKGQCLKRLDKHWR